MEKCDIRNEKACGTFSFTLAAEWDYVSKRNFADYEKNVYSISINERLNMAKTVQMLLETGAWKPYGALTDISKKKLLPFESGDKKRQSPLYNEYLYYNSHMRQLIYNQTDFDETRLKDYPEAMAEHGDAVSVLYRAVGKEELCLYRYIPQSGETEEMIKQYRLPVSSIELRVYSVGIMLLTVRCQNEGITQNGYYKYRVLNKRDGQWQLKKSKGKPCECCVEKVDDLSWIENCGRRLFAARTIEEGNRDDAFYNDYPIYSCIAPDGNANPIMSKENNVIVLCDLAKLVGMLNIPCTEPEHLSFTKKLIAPSCITKAVLKSAEVDDGDYLVIDSFNDDRMYVHGTIESKKIAEQTQTGWKNRKGEDTWENLSPWYGILYSDPAWKATCKDKEMLVSAVEAATEPRWCGFATFHGMTYHSMVMLAGSYEECQFLVSNNDWMYLQMFLIAVLQRCAVQRFYREASGLLQTYSIHDDVLRAAVQDKYTLFLNRFWFYELTEQEQGRLMFDKLQKAMSIERDVAFLDRALEELHQQQENRTNGMVNRILVPLSVLGGIWAFTEMGLRLRDALVANNGPNLMFFHGAGALFTWILLVILCTVMLWYLRNQGDYLWQLFGRYVKSGYNRIRCCITRGMEMFRRMIKR